jgi:hypothetical protein
MAAPGGAGITRRGAVGEHQIDRMGFELAEEIANMAGAQNQLDIVTPE